MVGGYGGLWGIQALFNEHLNEHTPCPYSHFTRLNYNEVGNLHI